MQYSTIKHPDSVLDILISQILHTSSDHKSSKSTIYKILYDLKQNLDPKNPITNDIPFYWYFHGPISDPINDHITKMEHRGIIERELLQNGWPLIQLKHEISMNNYPGLDEVYSILSNILKGFDFSKTAEYREKIYRKYAPFSFMNTFKHDYLKRLESLNYKIEQRIKFGESVNESELQKEFGILEKYLFNSENELSVNPIFEDFQEFYSSFVTGTFRIIEMNLDETDLIKFSLRKQILEFQNETTWNTFALGVRIPDEGHDSFYNDNVPVWTEKFDDSLIRYETVVDDYYSDSVDHINLNRLKSRIINDQNKSILASTLSGYLGYGE